MAERQPKIGEPVLYYPAQKVSGKKELVDPKDPTKGTHTVGDTDPDADFKSDGNDGPFHAIVTRQFGSGDKVIPAVNLTVFPDQAGPIFRSSVPHESLAGKGHGYWKYAEES